MTAPLRRLAPQPNVVNRCTHVGEDVTVAADKTDHPVHARITWRAHDGTQTTEWAWGLIGSWSPTALSVTFWRHGQQQVWLAREDVEPCTCTTLHERGWWPAD